MEGGSPLTWSVVLGAFALVEGVPGLQHHWRVAALDTVQAGRENHTAGRSSSKAAFFGQAFNYNLFIYLVDFIYFFTKMNQSGYRWLGGMCEKVGCVMGGGGCIKHFVLHLHT